MELTLTTERLVLRPFGSTDIDVLIATACDPDVMRYIREPTPRDEVADLIPPRIKRGAGGRLGVWCVVERETNETIGTSILMPLPTDEDEIGWNTMPDEIVATDNVEVGYQFAVRAWGNGYGTETCRRLIQFAFENSPLDQVCAVFNPENVASRRVLEKSGMTLRGTRRAYGEELPDIRITREEWQSCVAMNP